MTTDPTSTNASAQDYVISWRASIEGLLSGHAPAWCAPVMVAIVGRDGLRHLPRLGGVLGQDVDALLAAAWSTLVEEAPGELDVLVGERVGVLVDAVGSVVLWPDGAEAEYFDLDPGLGRLVDAASEATGAGQAESVMTLDAAGRFEALARDLRDLAGAGFDVVHVTSGEPAGYYVRLSPEPRSPGEVSAEPVAPWLGQLRVLRRECVVLR